MVPFHNPFPGPFCPPFCPADEFDVAYYNDYPDEVTCRVGQFVIPFNDDPFEDFIEPNDIKFQKNTLRRVIGRPVNNRILRNTRYNWASIGPL